MGIIIIRKKGIGRCLSYLLEKIEFIANEDLYFAAIFGFSPRSYETYEYFNCKSFKYTITFLCNVWLTILHWIDLHTSAPPSASSSLHDLINLAHVASLKITQQRKLLPPWKSESNWQPSWARRPGTTLPRTVTEISFAVEKLQRTYRRSSLRRSIVWIRRRSYFVGEVSRSKRSTSSACFGLLRWRISSPGRYYDEPPGEVLRLPSPLRHFFPLPAGCRILISLRIRSLVYPTILLFTRLKRS